ncbi:hypothetical protein GE061_017788 [Apolygus lucorum]|uniref:Uncharacterized protein n=1 Tax=Apolygus lucorum TaxID=248454 RepID=A0A8S9XDE6_APOLU|nr:hypothetical protein GE061_017788 [Apolygus lucorum]
MVIWSYRCIAYKRSASLIKVAALITFVHLTEATGVFIAQHRFEKRRKGVESAHTEQIKVSSLDMVASVSKKIVMYAGLLLVCCLGIVAAGDEPLIPSQFHTHHQWNHGPSTTVCIQVRGPHGPELCGPVVPPPDSKDQPEMMAGSRSSDSLSTGIIQADQIRSAQGGDWISQQPNPSMPLRSAVLQGFIGNGPVYQMEPGRAMEHLPPLVRVNSFAQQPPVASMRAPEQPLNQPPCMEQGVRFAGPPPQVMMAPPEMPPAHFLNSPPQMRTFPFAPFGFEQPPAPQPQFQMKPALPARSSNAQLMPAVRSADCLDNMQQSAAAMRSGSSSFDSTVQQQDVKQLAKQCAEQEKEIQEKKEVIIQLEQQLEKLKKSAREASSTTIEEKTITTKSSQGQTMDKETKKTDKEFENSSRQSSDTSAGKKRK